MAYISKALGPKAQALSTHEKECMVVILAISKWKSYLQHKEFTILAYHKSLIHLGEQRSYEGMQQKAFMILVSKKQKRIFFIITLSEFFAQVALIPLLSKLQLVLQEGC